MSDNSDQMQGAPTQTSDAPNQLPDSGSQSPPSLFQQVMQSSVAPTQTSDVNGQIPQPQDQQPVPQSDSVEQARQARDAALQNHPAVAQASVLHKVAETLAGGPRIVTKIDPATGEASREKVPLTSKQILLGSLANILGSVGQVSSNLSNRMQGRAPQPIQPLPTQVAAQQQAQQSEEDFNRIQNQKVRQAKVMNANLEAMRTAYALGKENDDAKDSVINNHKDDLENWSKAGAVEASSIPSDELLKKGFDKTRYVAIPDGRVPVFNPDGTRASDSNGVPLSQLTYSVVDGTTQAPLSQSKYDQLAKYGLMQSKEGFKLPEGSTISSAQLALMNHKLDLIDQTQREIDEVAGPGKVDLAARIKANPKLLSSIEAFHNDAASTDPVQQLRNMRTSKNPAVQGAVGNMISLFGSDNLDKWVAKNQQAPDKMSLEDAKQILADPRTDPNSNAAKTARGALELDRQQAAQKAAAETTARTNAEAAASPASQGLSVPKGFTPNPNASELSSDDLKSDLTGKGVKVPSNYDALYAVAHNAADLKTLPNNPRKGSNQMSAQEGLAFIRQYINPQYQEGDYAAASGLSKELASTRQGTAGGSLLSAGVASNHLDLLASAGDALKNNDTQILNRIANKLGVAVGNSPAVTFSAIADQVNSEVGKVVAGGTPHEAELAKLAQNLNTDQSPEQINSVIRAYVNLMSGRVNEINERSQQYFGRDVKGVSPETAKVFAKYGVAVPGYVQVKVNGQAGVIPKGKLADFRKQYPNAEVQQ